MHTIGWKAAPVLVNRADPTAFGNAHDGPLASITELDERCSMINLDPDTAASDPEVMRTVVRERDNNAGIYAVPTRGGAVAIGDEAFVRSSS